MSNYLEDKDLAFLKDCPNEDLKALADLLVFDKDGKKRWNEKLSETVGTGTCPHGYL